MAAVAGARLPRRICFTGVPLKRGGPRAFEPGGAPSFQGVSWFSGQGGVFFIRWGYDKAPHLAGPGDIGSSSQ